MAPNSNPIELDIATMAKGAAATAANIRDEPTPAFADVTGDGSNLAGCRRRRRGGASNLAGDDTATSPKASPTSPTSPVRKRPGPPPSGRRYSGIPVPSWFRPSSAETFRRMEMRDSDVVLSSFVKAGTTWVHTILRSLLHTFDDDGNEIPAACGGGGVGSAGQAYPDALPLDADERRRCLADPSDVFRFTRNFFGDFTFEELLGQPEPRLISTHLFGRDLLPMQLLGLDDDGNDAPDRPGKGRLVVVLRNLKDVLVSLHYFRGEAKDGWLGNEHGSGSFARFLDDDCPNAFGSPFDWIRGTDEAVRMLEAEMEKYASGKSRVMVVYYEALKENLGGQLERMHDFLGLGPLSDAKRAAVERAMSFDVMKQSRTNGSKAKDKKNQGSKSKGGGGKKRANSVSSMEEKKKDDAAIVVGDVPRGVSGLPVEHMITSSSTRPCRRGSSNSLPFQLLPSSGSSGNGCRRGSSIPKCIIEANGSKSSFAEVNNVDSDCDDDDKLSPSSSSSSLAVDVKSQEGNEEEKEKKQDIIMRKGQIRDWTNHLTPHHWEKFDAVFERKLGDVCLAQPLRRYQRATVPGLPSQPRDEWTLDTDPRTWPTFERVTLQDGMIVPDNLIKRASSSAAASKGFVRPPSEISGTIPSAEHPAEPGRYHLFTSAICPWACSVACAVFLLGLQEIVKVHVSDGQSGEGWVYLKGVSAPPFASGSEGLSDLPFWLHEVYRLHDCAVTTRVTVPVLWDSETQKIVSNDSWDIVKMLSTGFAGMGVPPKEISNVLGRDEAGNPTLLPSGLAEQIEAVHADLYHRLLNGVYRAGLGLMRNGDVMNDAVLSARRDVLDTLDELNELFATSRFLLGGALTAADIRLAMTLLRYDAAYRCAFRMGKCDRGGILTVDGGKEGYPHIRAYLRDVRGVLRGCNDGVDFRAYGQYYRIKQAIEAQAKSRRAANTEEEKYGETPSMLPLPDMKAIALSADESPGERP